MINLYMTVITKVTEEVEEEEEGSSDDDSKGESEQETN